MMYIVHFSLIIVVCVSIQGQYAAIFSIVLAFSDDIDDGYANFRSVI